MARSRITTVLLLGLSSVSGLPGVVHAQLCYRPNRDYDGKTVVSDRADGVSSDRRGPYIKGEGGVIDSRAGGEGVLTLFSRTGTESNSRTFRVNLNNPVPSGGGIPLGTITSNLNGSGLVTQRRKIADTVLNLADIAVGQTEAAAQVNVSFRIGGRFHVLQMGPQENGHCITTANRVHGNGSSPGTISRPGPTRWVIDVPPGSIGRLFDIEDGHERAVDRGLYHIQLHYEIIEAVPHLKNVLEPLANAKGGAAVVARYRALKRDSASAYVFNPSQLTGIGNSLLKNKDANGAVLVFRLNVEEYPENANAYANLGEAYLATGDTASAIANYRRTLHLNPGNTGAADILRRLERRPSVRTTR